MRNEALDPIDATLVNELSRDARATNAQLANSAGVAASTAHARLRSLESRQVITGYHAAIDQARLGRGLQAMIGVTLRPGSRQESITAFAEAVQRLPQVIQTFFVGGSDDYIVHVAVQNSSALRAMVVEHISGQPSVASTRTSVIFAHHRNAVVSGFD
ncbi:MULTISPECIES: Lrp/AsnC family transcriptional regulator [unclassified Microbacterium]|uniref:Lrp/AsnC family transcriptional regulator n=1 Tax=unclassified Microbacterium TaxID=2609290 RepID=UPI00214B0492|nr:MULTISPECIES: Lrp/AsnC family transcriptional regulator [unclassified Microbacterium]MCR2810622.1 Lrp/AsnC family transcriptional regulator [Microbacterium sp. zg.B185]WIM18159.1 Lrp/AsnC family transcriptional regulator [Microbacterium sp. zg-B185]